MAKTISKKCKRVVISVAAKKKEAAAAKRQKEREKIEAAKKKKFDNYLLEYADLAAELLRPIKVQDLMDIGLSEDKLRHYFGSLSKLDSLARDAHPDKFHDVAVSKIMTAQSYKQLDKVIRSYHRFVITTAVTGCAIDAGFMAAIKEYCRINDAAPLVLVASDPAHNRAFNKDYGSIDKRIIDAKWNVVVRDTQINSNLFLSTIKLSAKQINPMTGLLRIGQERGSFIYASPKQSLKAIPISNEKMPRVAMTTGAITKPVYTTENYMSQRTAYIAQNDHVIGAVIVEVVDNNIYHFRQIQAAKDGSFIDLGVKYSGKAEPEMIPGATVVLGDWHSGETDPVVRTRIKEVIDVVQAEQVVVHDLFSGIAINPHEGARIITQAIKSKKGLLSLEDELKMVAKELEYLCSLTKKVVVVKSNHDEFLKRWLQDGQFIKDSKNLRVALELAIAYLDFLDPLRYGVEKIGELSTKDQVTWLKRDADFKIAGIQLGAHGDRGPNGSYGSVMSMEAAYGKSVTGHNHSPAILRDAWQVGTCTKLRLNYNIGPSSWMHTICIVYPNGMRQMINFINGSWCYDYP